MGTRPYSTRVHGQMALQYPVHGQMALQYPVYGRIWPDGPVHGQIALYTALYMARWPYYRLPGSVLRPLTGPEASLTYLSPAVPASTSGVWASVHRWCQETYMARYLERYLGRYLGGPTPSA